MSTAAPQSESTMSSPKDTKLTTLPKEESRTTDPKPQAATQEAPKAVEPRADPAAPTSNPEEAEGENKSTSNAPAPLAPPPKPGQYNNEAPDYFAANHKENTHFSLEPNPFEQSFGNPSTGETPGRFPALPSVASLTSPAPLGGGATPGWQLGNSLRSGPLSPAMLTGPAQPTSYFDDHFRQSFPTPNESSLRTGLTPGGGGSMFPAPSPNTTAMFNSLSGGLATPGTLDFHRTALNAATRNKVDNNSNNHLPQQQHPHAHPPPPGPVSKQEFQAPAPPASMNQDPMGNHPDRDAVNSLYMLAQTGNRNNQFAVPPVPQQVQQARMHQQHQYQDTSPTSQRGRQMDGSPSDQSDKAAGGKGRGKKNSIGKQGGKRKSDGPPGKAPANKRGKSSADMMDMDDDDMFDEDDIKEDPDQLGPNGKKMTDEEKRKNFLERNRVAALKCRQRKKQWLANLQAKVEIFTSENDALNAQNQQLREEIMNLKTLLMAHRDCPVSHQQGLAGATMSQVIGADFAPQPNPYGMQGMPQNGQQMQGPPMQHPGPGMQRS